MKEQESMKKISFLVDANLIVADDGHISDLWGWDRSANIAWQTRMHPDQIIKAPGAPHVALDLNALASFVQAHPAGTLALRRGSCLERTIGFSEAGTAKIEGERLSTPKIGSVRLRRSKRTVYRYAAVGRSGEE
jgi:hypothetical protein